MDFDATVGRFASWPEIVEGVRRERPGAIDDLYSVVVEGARPKLLRWIGAQNADDQLHEVVLIVLKAIYRGDLRQPERFLAFVRTITQRRIYSHIKRAAFARKVLVPVEFAEPAVAPEESPEALYLALERTEAMHAILARLGSRDREIITRFYLQEQDRRQVCAEMGLSDTQFRLFKSRALVRCAHISACVR